jgi:hypothetical protein
MKKGSSNNNHANQMNPNHSQYRGGDNRANQKNPNNAEYKGPTAQQGAAPAGTR